MKFSTRLIRKGALIEETRVVLLSWDLSQSVQGNLEQILSNNPVGAKSSGWLKEVRVTLASRLSELSTTELHGLVALAESVVENDVWTACLMWHSARVDRLYYQFSTRWLYQAYGQGVFRMRSEDVVPFVRETLGQENPRARTLSEYGTLRAARDLLRMAADFGLLTSAVSKEFVTYHLPEQSFLYLLHSMASNETNARRIVDSEDWHMYLMDATDVERELLRLHQFRKLHYEIAGSLAQLNLPYGSAADYARGLVP